MQTDISKRIKEIRESKNLSQEKFGEQIDLKRNSIAQIEIGVRNASERTLKAICRQFNINYSWLKDGIGEMESNFQSSILDDLVEEYNLDEVDRQIVENYMRLDQASKKVLKDYLKSLTVLWEEK